MENLNYIDTKSAYINFTCTLKKKRRTNKHKIRKDKSPDFITIKINEKLV
jgi:hypothetical protein